MLLVHCDIVLLRARRHARLATRYMNARLHRHVAGVDFVSAEILNGLYSSVLGCFRSRVHDVLLRLVSEVALDIVSVRQGVHWLEIGAESLLHCRTRWTCWLLLIRGLLLVLRLERRWQVHPILVLRLQKILVNAEWVVRIANWSVHIVVSWVPIASSIEFHLLEMRLNLLLLRVTE